MSDNNAITDDKLAPAPPVSKRLSSLESRVAMIERSGDLTWKVAKVGYLNSLNQYYRRAPLWVHAVVALCWIGGVVLGATYGWWSLFVLCVSAKAASDLTEQILRKPEPKPEDT